MRILNPLQYLGRAQNGEHWSLYDRLYSVITSDFVEKYKLLTFYQPFSDAYARECKAYSAITKSPKTKNIAESDKARDKGFRQVDLGVEMGLNDVDPDVVASAERCRIVMDAHRGASSKSYDNNTAEVDDVVELFMSDAYAEDIAKLGLTEKVASLKALNDAFKEAYMARIPEEYARDTAENMKAVRPVMDQAYEDLADAINAIYLIATYIEPNAENAAEIKAMADLINAVVHRFDKTLSNRRDGKPAEGEEQPQPTPGGEQPGEGEQTGGETQEPTEDEEQPGGEGETGEEQTPPDGSGEENTPQPGVDNDGDGSPEVV